MVNPKMDQEAVMNQVVAMRRARGMSQRDLATVSGIQQAAIGRMERLTASPTLDTLCRVLDALDAQIVIEPRQRR